MARSRCWPVSMSRAIDSRAFTKLPTMKISLGPIPHRWSRNAVMTFYDAVALSSVDVVYIGSVVCTERHQMQHKDWFAIARYLASHGKEVVLSTSALTKSDADLSRLRKLVSSGEFALEVNDLATLEIGARGAPFIAGPNIECPNVKALNRLVELGAIRWVAQPNCIGKVLHETSQMREAACEIEVPVFGPEPIAVFASRVADQYNGGGRTPRRRLFTGGLEEITSLGEDNVSDGRGSGGRPGATNVVDWSHEIEALSRSGVSVLRITPQTPQTPQTPSIVQMLTELVHGDICSDEAYRRWCDLQHNPRLRTR
ncbi:hypothetical protein LMG28614_06249 [Paraburkholderia ultramafica]|uniref:U32 family peptidase n=2 Tax=Paraburkholderia ultramafica TaxID=1544867 RepID=A0A6S7BM75_9BURK|nr:hypothetical protein LMG28614_06249 [Paraburkholderia ultramafica]